MKSVQFDRRGGLDVIRVVELPVPEPGPGQVRVKVTACGLNFSDIMIRQGRYVTDVPFPYQAGMEFSGVVDALEDGVRNVKLGEAVFGLSFYGGAMAQYVVVDAASVNPVPAGVLPAEAAALQIQGITALFCVEDYGRVQNGETVVVHSAAGGLGGLAVQIAIARGARVMGTASRDEKLRQIRDLGAEAINYANGDWVAEVKKLTSGRGADVIIDGVGGELFRRSVFEATTHGGRIVISGVASAQEVGLTNFQISAAHRTLIGVSLPSFFPDHIDRILSAMHRLFGMMGKGQLRVRIGHDLPLEKAVEAFRLLEERSSVGKVVVRP
jgi:NADPH2:quinone reductase